MPEPVEEVLDELYQDVVKRVDARMEPEKAIEKVVDEYANALHGELSARYQFERGSYEDLMSSVKTEGWEALVNQIPWKHLEREYHKRASTIHRDERPYDVDWKPLPERAEELLELAPELCKEIARLMLGDERPEREAELDTMDVMLVIDPNEISETHTTLRQFLEVNDLCMRELRHLAVLKPGQMVVIGNSQVMRIR